ncbi:hypothetical protein MLGJGCBP_01839 [Rhodococcus sp. T7]|nr:hypothetical protein MLGJGCBP_01839 [Rhodococcus sp. T7]
MTLSEGFHAEVEVRWSDMDVFQHINHARMVTLLEEARIPWLFEDDRPTVTLRDGAASPTCTCATAGSSGTAIHRSTS